MANLLLNFLADVDISQVFLNQWTAPINMGQD